MSDSKGLWVCVKSRSIVVDRNEIKQVAWVGDLHVLEASVKLKSEPSLAVWGGGGSKAATEKTGPWL